MMINHIEIPERFVRVAAAWHSGPEDLLYAVSSTGGLTTGTIQPTDTEEEWYLGLWQGLLGDVGYAASCAKEGLAAFATWVANVLSRLEKEYATD